jgi:dTDP-4-dehydrorhamnose 3,5-epimerase-like enzyme
MAAAMVEVEEILEKRFGFPPTQAAQTLLASECLFGRTQGSRMALPISDTWLVKLAQYVDQRGGLIVAQIERELPFAAQRFFMIDAVPVDAIRGKHAHAHLEEFLVCARGSCVLNLDDSVASASVVLDSNTAGLYLPPKVYRTLTDFSPNALLVVLASLPYDPDDYVYERPGSLDHQD